MPDPTPAERLRKIVADARGDDLERMEKAVRTDLGLWHREMPTPPEAMTGPYTDSLIRERAAWQAAADLLERLLELYRQQQDPGPAGGTR